MKFPKTKEHLCIAALLLLFLSIAFYDIVFLGKTFKATTANSQAMPWGAYGQENNKPKFIPVNGTDTPVMEEPLLQFIKESLRQGILPLWNPHQACGFPIIGMLELGLFFPLHFIFYLLPSLYSWDILILSRLFLAGIFAYWFMRTLRFQQIPALCTGICFMLSGPLLLLQYWTANVDILTPLLLITTDRLIRQPHRRNIVYLTLVIGLTFFAGHPEHIFLVNFYNVCFFIFRLLSSKKILESSLENTKKIFFYFSIANVLGIISSSIVLLPFLRNLLSEFWIGHPPGTGLLMEEQADRALTLALPHFFQQVPLTYTWIFSGWWGGYLGTIPLAFACISLFNKQKNGLNYFFATLAFLIISKQYGLSFINWIGYLPLFNVCRYAIHAPVLAAFSVAVLAGMGVRTILFNRNVFYKALPYTIGLIAITLFHLFRLQTTKTFPIAFKATFFVTGVLCALQILLLLKDKKILKQKMTSIFLAGILFTELFLYIHREHPRRFDSFPKVPYMEFLKSSPERARSYGIFWAFYPNTASGFGVDDLGVFLSLVPKRFVNFSNRLLKKNHFQNNLRPPALRALPLDGNRPIQDLLNVKYQIFPSIEWLSKIFPRSARLPPDPVYSKEVNIFERPSAFPRAFIVHRVIFQPDEKKSLALLERWQQQLREMAIINSPPIPKISQHFNDLPARDNSTAEIIKYSPNKVVIKAYLENPGLLVLSDAYHPDWKAYANGHEVHIFQTDYLLRSILLPAGNFEVQFVFKPTSFYIGGLLSFLTFSILIYLYLSHRRKIS